MDYNNGYYSGGYQQPYYGNPGAAPDRVSQYRAPYQQGQPAQNMPAYGNMNANAPQNNPIWVQGEEGAKAYMVARNSTVVLWDVENPVIYLKSADESGMPSMRIFDLRERVPFPKEPPAASVEYITRGEFDALKARLDELLQRESGIKPAENRANVNKREDKRNG